MAQILAFSEKDDLAFELVSKGKEFSAALNMGLAAALLGEGASARADEYFAYGADRVYVAEHPALADFHAETYAEALYQIAQQNGAQILLLASTKRGKELAPRVAQKLGAGCVTDATAVEVRDGNLLVSRYALGGNTVASEFIRTPHKVIAVMPRTFELGAKEAREGEIVTVALDLKEPRTRIVGREEKAGEAVNLEEAEVLVCIGRGLEKKEDLGIIEELARALGAEIGCTKTLCSDYQWLSEERLVGLSGKKTSPRLVISIGISGQIQYTVGIRGARIAVAINKDSQAPIFALSDYGIVGDLYQVVPKLVEALQAA
ncbi:MAG TPA: electron transfer flavoprotein subunit alpha/FixB family protein [Anaerolineae bacterium]|nr:electron transfer flavoprotein subunit alpha/FixB family protein [Anaerolineae bacterium]